MPKKHHIFTREQVHYGIGSRGNMVSWILSISQQNLNDQFTVSGKIFTPTTHFKLIGAEKDEHIHF